MCRGLSRNSEGVFAIHLNSVLVFSHTDNRPFHRINGDKKPEYHFGGTHFAQDTNPQVLLSVAFCQGPFRRHDQTHSCRTHDTLFVFDKLWLFDSQYILMNHMSSVPKVMLPNLSVCSVCSYQSHKTRSDRTWLESSVSVKCGSESWTRFFCVLCEISRRGGLEADFLTSFVQRPVVLARGLLDSLPKLRLSVVGKG